MHTEHPCGRAGIPPRTRPGVDPRVPLGRLGEQLAAAHLERLGFAVVARNVRTRHGEIDLIVFDGHTLVVVEVKTRRIPAGGRADTMDAGAPLDGLRPRQRVRLRRLTAAWLSERGPERPRAREIRFDAVGVLLDPRRRLLRLEHLEGAW